MLKKLSLYAVLLILLSQNVKAEVFKSGNLYFQKEVVPNRPTTEVSVVYSATYTDLSEVAIPSTVTYKDTVYTVTRIYPGCFKSCSSLSKIAIAPTVYYIGAGAFTGTALFNDAANWHDNVLYIDNCLIVSKNRSVTSYDVPEGTQVIAEEAFEGGSIKELSLPSSLIGISDYSFSDCPVAEVELPSGLKYLGSAAFQNALFTSLTLPSTLEYVGYISFPWIKTNSRFDLYCYAVVPPVWELNTRTYALMGTSQYTGFRYSTIHAHVPGIVLEAYQSAVLWKQFTLTGDIEVSPVEDVTVSGVPSVQKIMEDGMIYLQCPDGKRYTLLGSELR